MIRSRTRVGAGGAGLTTATLSDRQGPFAEVMQANRAASRLMTMLLGEARMTRPLNHMRMFLAPDELRTFVVDWPDVAAALLARARHEAMAAPLYLALQSTWRELLKLPDVAAPNSTRPTRRVHCARCG